VRVRVAVQRNADGDAVAGSVLSSLITPAGVCVRVRVCGAWNNGRRLCDGWLVRVLSILVSPRGRCACVCACACALCMINVTQMATAGWPLCCRRACGNWQVCACVCVCACVEQRVAR
jgi:hypothetical protein